MNGPHVHFIVNPQVRDADPDIIAFQEVRSSQTSEDENQVAELNEILGQYQHRLFVSADKVIAPDKLYKTGWEIEGANSVILTVFKCSFIQTEKLQCMGLHVNVH